MARRFPVYAKEINGIEKVELEVFQTNTAAIAFYGKAGFRREGVRIRARRIDAVFDDLLLMGRKI
ncbi:MAG TPA: N-acetyltransferase [bacterium]|nr:N-acetyltransferase [bacterium]